MIRAEDVVAFTLFACWGSFLNVLGYRLLRSQDIIFQRSSCPSCKHVLAWYDLIPVFSWFFLQGRCRYCSSSISVLYLLIELMTACLLLYAWHLFEMPTFVVYGVFISALMVSIRTDLEAMLISSYMSLGIIPLAIIAAYYEIIPLSITESIVGSLVGYALLFIPARVYRYATGIDGMGEGDFELLAFIGAYTGAQGAWTSLMIGSLSGSIIGISWMFISGTDLKNTRIPFGPFLALGAFIYMLFL